MNTKSIYSKMEILIPDYQLRLVHDAIFHREKDVQSLRN